MKAAEEKLEQLRDDIDLGFLLKILNDKIGKMANTFMRHTGITFPQGKVLHFLHEQKNHEATQKQLEVFLNVSHPAVTGMIKRLEEKGFVKSEIQVNRRMQKTVRLTEKGISNHQDAKLNRASHERLLSGNLTTEERKTLIELLIKVYTSLSDGDSDDTSDAKNKN